MTLFHGPSTVTLTREAWNFSSNKSHLGAKSSHFQAKIRSRTRLDFTVALIKDTECRDRIYHIQYYEFVIDSWYCFEGSFRLVAATPT